MKSVDDSFVPSSNNPAYYIVNWRISRLDFVSWIFIKNFQTFLEVNIEINRDNLTPCQANWVLKNLLLGSAKDEHFSYFHSSCQLGLRPLRLRWKSCLANLQSQIYFPSTFCFCFFNFEQISMVYTSCKVFLLDLPYFVTTLVTRYYHF